ncbi:oxaloacetate decarboxylase alpha subunit/acetyl-CoA carboxylase biotin carboxyl carrier protein [Anaeroplasma bactoclasticum]|jgi:acetyl-CoA carboxylase biotin carboxyl carrier protein|uniref:Biotin carboxyl carrier protein of acetyl-CoA carboxylase n=1 Tax=Anaeroplasma bactoclasticum TaxID=2088 RepID=A0A397QYD9_9MOLU|nr:acetyl-CoA carboxylase biotin carboxyl carrier protein [Anaeroplasma bactoclasticum]RIA64955.1 oxaloacetate decarboxylase alpha subunit/acetyl-CoA carboxylase biotin carboxyl carrier protein [Anaeroplasma bactoclasticum]
MNLEEIEKLMKLLENSTLSYLEIEENGIKIKLDKNSGVREVSKPNVDETTNSLPKEVVNAPVGKEITAPLVGTFHQAPYKDAKPFVEVGQKVKKGQKLCIVEAMKVMNEITSPYDGTILEIKVKENDVVEFGKTLFIIGD